MFGKKAQPLLTPDMNSLKETYPVRRTILGILAVACLGIGLWLYGFAIVGKAPEAPPTAERKDEMLLTQKNPVRTAGMPPLDASAPTKTETATFALG